jgi:voltage-gated potassium channel Kch
MSTVPTFQLCLKDHAADAVQTLRKVTGLSTDSARVLVHAIDNVTAVVFTTIGIDAADARAVLATLWQHQPTAAGQAKAPPAPRPIGRTRIERDRQFLRSLGQRIHVIRRVRKLTLADASRGTGIPAEMLRTVEAGDLPPTLLGLRALADVLQVPMSLLVDEKATPLDVLRLLSGQPA